MELVLARDVDVSVESILERICDMAVFRKNEPITLTDDDRNAVDEFHRCFPVTVNTNTSGQETTFPERVL